MNDAFYQSIVDESPMGYAYHKIILGDNNMPCDYEFIEVNPAFQRLTGLKTPDILGKRISQVLPEILNDEYDWLGMYGDVAINGRVIEVDRFVMALNTWFRIKAYSPKKYYFVTCFTDISRETIQALDKAEESQCMQRLLISAQEFLQWSPEQVDYQKITDTLRVVSGAKYVAFNLYEENGKEFTTIAISGVKRDILKAASILKLDLIGKKWSHDPAREKKIARRMLTSFPSLVELTGDVIPKPMISLITKMFSIGQVLLAKIMKDGVILGDFTLMMPAGLIFNKENFVNIYTRQVGLLITRMQSEERTRKLLDQNETILDGTQDAIFFIQVLGENQYRYIRSNASYQRMTGLILSDNTPQGLFGPEVGKVLCRNYNRCIRERKTISYEESLNLPVGLRIWSTTLTPVFEKGKLAYIVGSSQDITERKKAENELKEEKELLKTTLLSIGDGIITTDRGGRVILLNEVAQNLTGWSQEEAYGEPFGEVFSIIDEDTKEKSEDIIKKVLNTGNIVNLDYHITLISKEGTQLPIAHSAAPIMDENGRARGVVLAFRDVSIEKQRQNAIEYLSYHDQLTGLYNRRFFEEELIRLDNYCNLPISIIMADVNGLKLANDAFRHDVGDKLLQKAAEVISSSCREDDVIARLGGDEFVILLPKTDNQEAEGMVRRIRDLCEKTHLGSVDLSISFGWETKTLEDQDMGEILKKAEDRMYRRKLFESPSLRGKTVEAIKHTLYETHPNEGEHSEKVSQLCEALGRALSFNDKELKEIKMAGLLHDIGKIALDGYILNKAEPLLDEEWREIKRHPEIGYRILSSVNHLSDTGGYILSHHERWDGKGYPKGLSGDDIPFQSRIITIADAYDAMTSERPYRSPLSIEEAVQEIKKNAGKQFDPELARVFVEKVLKEEW